MDRDEFFFPGGGRQEVLDALFEGIRRSGVVLLLVGAAGSGRSALIRRFVAEADPQALAVAVVSGDILMSPVQLLGGLRDALGFPPVAHPADDLWRAVQAIRDESRDVVLFVDDAHELGMEARGEIVRFALEADVALVLTGDESLAPAMNPEVPFEVLALRPFDEEESEAFVAAWLAVEDEDELPSNRVMAKLHRHSAGMPGRLAGLLGSGAATRERLLPNGIPPWHVLMGVGAVIVLGIVVAFVLTTNPVGEEVGPVERVVTLPPPGQAVVDNNVRARNGADVAVPLPMDARVYAPPVKVNPVPEGAASTAVVAGGGAAASPVQDVPAPAPVPMPATPAAASPPKVAPLSPAQPTPAGSRLTTSQATPVVSGPSRYTADEQALLAEPRSRYTVQLFASFNEGAVQAFMARHRGTEMKVFRTVREDLPWYVAVTGMYRNRDEAKAAVARLPLDLQALKPWARSLQGVQDELRRRRN